MARGNTQRRWDCVCGVCKRVWECKCVRVWGCVWCVWSEDVWVWVVNVWVWVVNVWECEGVYCVRVCTAWGCVHSPDAVLFMRLARGDALPLSLINREWAWLPNRRESPPNTMDWLRNRAVNGLTRLNFISDVSETVSRKTLSILFCKESTSTSPGLPSRYEPVKPVWLVLVTSRSLVTKLEESLRRTVDWLVDSNCW